MLMEELTTEELKDAMRKGESYFCYEPKGSGEGKAPRIVAIHVDESEKTITIDANGLVYWIYATDKTSSSASSARSTVVGIGDTFSYKGYQGSYVRALITNMYGETCTQPISFKDVNATSLENINGESTTNGKDVRKVLIDNILYIVRDGQIFDARGARVK
jgi:hypothetical protein